MRPFLYPRAGGPAAAVEATTSRDRNRVLPTMAAVQYLAGGTTLLDLMKLDVMRPKVMVDINPLDPAGTRIALGGVAAKPWRAREAETVLSGGAIDEAAARHAAPAAFAGAQTHGDNNYEPERGKRTLVRPLLQAAQLGV